jgi:transcriptional regulator with XRE-family HTH domain
VIRVSVNKEDSNFGNKTVFAENFNYYLQKNNERKIDIAKLLGVSQATVCDWTKMRTYPRMDKIQILAEHWGIEMSDLVEKRTLLDVVERQKQKIAAELLDDGEAIVLYQAIKKLSPANREIVSALIKSLTKEEN